MRILIDTHVWVWWATEDHRLSRRARSLIRDAQREGDMSLSLISVWEVAKKVEKGQLVLDRAVDEWLEAAANLPGLQVLELTRPVLVAACQLPPLFHGDPADQIIVATARQLGATLVTKDQRIREYPHVQSTW